MRISQALSRKVRRCFFQDADLHPGTRQLRAQPGDFSRFRTHRTPTFGRREVLGLLVTYHLGFEFHRKHATLTGSNRMPAN